MESAGRQHFLALAWQSMFFMIQNTQLDEKIESGYEKSDPPRAVLILAAWEPPKPIHFWKGHRKSGRNEVAKIFPEPREIGVPRGWGRKIFKVWLVIYQIKGKRKSVGLLIEEFDVPGGGWKGRAP